jgi:hypothetical protein
LNLWTFNLTTLDSFRPSGRQKNWACWCTALNPILFLREERTP